MKLTSTMGSFLAWVVLLLFPGGISGPDRPACEVDPECYDDLDPNPRAPGYFLGPTVVPSECYSETGMGINDLDDDHVADHCEEQVAEHFRPSLVFSSYESWHGREPYWAAKYFPNVGVFRVAYLLSYYGDNGITNPTLWTTLSCPVFSLAGMVLTFNGLRPAWVVDPITAHLEDVCGGHIGDSEFIIVDVRYDPETSHWVLYKVFYSAHWGTVGNTSSHVIWNEVDYPVGEKLRGYPRVWVSESKHANYPSRTAHSGT